MQREKALGLRELVLLYVIVEYNREQMNEAKRRKIPQLALPSAVKPCTITVLWSKNDPDSRINRFIRQYRLGIADVPHSEQIYRAADKLRDAGLMYPTDERQSFIPTQRGIDIANKLRPIAPSEWPKSIPYDHGYTYWELAKLPLPVAV